MQLNFHIKVVKIIFYNRLNGDFHEIIVEDFGMGMSSENLNKMFMLGEIISQPGTNQEKGKVIWAYSLQRDYSKSRR